MLPLVKSIQIFQCNLARIKLIKGEAGLLVGKIQKLQKEEVSRKKAQAENAPKIKTINLFSVSTRQNLISWVGKILLKIHKSSSKVKNLKSSFLYQNL